MAVLIFVLSMSVVGENLVNSCSGLSTSSSGKTLTPVWVQYRMTTVNIEGVPLLGWEQVSNVSPTMSKWYVVLASFNRVVLIDSS